MIINLIINIAPIRTLSSQLISYVFMKAVTRGKEEGGYVEEPPLMWEVEKQLKDGLGWL